MKYTDLTAVEGIDREEMSKVVGGAGDNGYAGWVDGHFGTTVGDLYTSLCTIQFSMCNGPVGGSPSGNPVAAQGVSFCTRFNQQEAILGVTNLGGFVSHQALSGNVG